MTKRPPKPSDRIAAPRYRRRTPKESQPYEEINTLRDLSRALPEQDEFDSLERDLMGASDRAVAIIAASLAERSLEYAILARMERHDLPTVKKLTDNDGALGGFWGKTYLAYAMGIFDNKMLKHLEIIRRVRNAFAHSAKNVTFSTPQIITECKGISAPRSYLNKKPVEISLERWVFVGVCHNVTTVLLANAALGMIACIRRLEAKLAKEKASQFSSPA